MSETPVNIISPEVFISFQYYFSKLKLLIRQLYAHSKKSNLCLTFNSLLRNVVKWPDMPDVKIRTRVSLPQTRN